MSDLMSPMNDKRDCMNRGTELLRNESLLI